MQVRLKAIRGQPLSESDKGERKGKGCLELGIEMETGSRGGGL